MPGITSLGHLALRVKDLDASLDFYRDRLGLMEMHPDCLQYRAIRALTEDA